MLHLREMEGHGVSIALACFKTVAFVFDVLTFPVYAILQRPWKKRALSRRVKAIAIAHDDKSITYKSVDAPKAVHQELIDQKVDTMEVMFEYAAKKYPNRNCLGTREIFGEEEEIQPNGKVQIKYNMGEYKWKTYTEVNLEATNFGKGLRQLGNEPRKNIVIFAETRAEWMIAAHGLFKQNIPLVTIYATLGDDAIAHGINETEVTTVITTHDLMPKFKNILKMTPKVDTLIYMEDPVKELDTEGYKDDVEIIRYGEVVRIGSEANYGNSSPSPDDVAIIMYTSGSTGVPKGVIILHSNLISTLKAFSDFSDYWDDDVMIGFLPLAHVFELLVESLCLVAGICIGYSSALTLLDTSVRVKSGARGDAAILKPTRVTSVPLILDRISNGVLTKVSKGSTIAKAMFKFAYDYKVSWVRSGYSTPLIDRLIFSKVRNLLGGRVRIVYTGGAPLSTDTHELIKTCLCVTVIQGYGLTETTSCATVMDEHDLSEGRVGATTNVCCIRLIDWAEANYKITDKPYPRGELLVGGENVSIGYYKLPEKTEEDFFVENGTQWFKTGDICEVHEDGVVKIIDRKKDLVKLQAGEYLALGKIEMEFKTSSLIDNICVYGDSHKKYCVGLVVPNQDALIQLAHGLGFTEKRFEDLCEVPEVVNAVLEDMKVFGKKCKLQKFEIPAAIKLVKEVWTPEMGLVTAAFKLKRKDIQKYYEREIKAMYASK